MDLPIPSTWIVDVLQEREKLDDIATHSVFERAV